MNYFPFHIGDYVSATRHLSWEEDAAFRRMLDTYYTTEKPLPADLRAVCRLVMAQTDSQREAVRVVLEEFFTLTADGWVNKRAEVELDAMRDKQQKQRDKANKRWHKPDQEHGNAVASANDATASKSDADAMPPTPTPTPTPKKEIQDPPAARVPPAAAGPRPAKKCPPAFDLTAENLAWARSEAPGIDVERETQKFRDHTFATARTDWAGTWRNWMRKAAESAPAQGPRQAESFKERDSRIAAERVKAFTGGLAHDRKAAGEFKPLPFERGYVETIEGEAHEPRRIAAR